MAETYKHLRLAYDLQIRYEPFFLDCHPDQESVKLPFLFNKEHGHEISASVLLCDPRGNMFQIIMDTKDGEATFVKGWNEVAKFYGLLLGCWVKLIYVRHDRFIITLRDRLDQEIVYPTPPKIVWIGDTPRLLAYTMGDTPTHHLLTICKKPDLFHVLEKTLSFADVYSGLLHIPYDFCEIAFRQTGIRVILYDEYGLEVSCSLNFRSDSPCSCGVGEGWYIFSNVKKLAPGQRIQIGVPSTNPKMLSFTVFKV